MTIISTVEKDFGNVAFGGKDSGVSIGLYKKEMEPDTPKEYWFFKQLYDYVVEYEDSGEPAFFTDINIDEAKRVFPSIFDVSHLYGKYAYRGTILRDADVEFFLDNVHTAERVSLTDELHQINTYYLWKDSSYSLSKYTQSWTTRLHIAHDFAMANLDAHSEKYNITLPCIIRMVIDDSFFMNPTFMNFVGGGTKTAGEFEIMHHSMFLHCDILVESEFVENNILETTSVVLSNKVGYHRKRLTPLYALL